ncbi:MAG: sugar nucleotide-binding protein [Terracidiphilus sp.]
MDAVESTISPTRGETTWHGFAKALLNKLSGIFGFTVPNLIPIKVSEFPLSVKRPSDSRLSWQRLEQTYGVTLHHWEHALSLVLIHSLKDLPQSVPGSDFCCRFVP